MTLTSEEAQTAIVAATTVLKESVDAGMYIGKDCIPAIGVFVQFGLAVRSYITYTEPGDKDPVLKLIEELTQKLGTIEDKMKNSFDVLKAFISQYSFYNDVPIVGHVLSKSLHDATLAGTEAGREEFRKKYDQYRPLEYAMRLNHQLSKATTNPLKMLMAADPVNGKLTFETWKNIYESVMTQLCSIEATASSYINEGNEYRKEKILLEDKKFKKMIKGWHDDYKTDDHYWPDSVRVMVEEFQDKNQTMGSAEKARLIREKLDNILTLDILTVVVFNEKKFEYYPDHSSQLIVSPDRGNCTVFVYRSLNAVDAPAEVEKFKNSVKAQSKKLLEYEREKDFILRDDLRSKTTLLRESGLVLAVKGTDVAVEATRHSLFPDGVGEHFTGKMTCKNPHHHNPSPEMPYFLFSAYK